MLSIQSVNLPLLPPFLAVGCALWQQVPSFNVAPLPVYCDQFTCLCFSLDWELPEGRDHVFFIPVLQRIAQ